MGGIDMYYWNLLYSWIFCAFLGNVIDIMSEFQCIFCHSVLVDFRIIFEYFYFAHRHVSYRMFHTTYITFSYNHKYASHHLFLKFVIDSTSLPSGLVATFCLVLVCLVRLEELNVSLVKKYFKFLTLLLVLKKLRLRVYQCHHYLATFSPPLTQRGNCPSLHPLHSLPVTIHLLPRPPQVRALTLTFSVLEKESLADPNTD